MFVVSDAEPDLFSKVLAPGRVNFAGVALHLNGVASSGKQRLVRQLVLKREGWPRERGPTVLCAVAKRADRQHESLPRHRRREHEGSQPHRLVGEAVWAIACHGKKRTPTKRRPGGPRLPELDEGPAEGRGEPRTIERPRMRARLVDQGEPARPPWAGRRRDPMPPPSPGESGAGSPEAESTGSGREDETAAGPQPKKARRGGRASRPPYNHREANRRTDRAGGGPNRRRGREAGRRGCDWRRRGCSRSDAATSVR